MSVSIYSPIARGRLPVERWTSDDHGVVMRAALRALDGVGDRERGHTEDGEIAFHLRRPMTPAEAASLPRRKAEPTFPIERAKP